MQPGTRIRVIATKTLPTGLARAGTCGTVKSVSYSLDREELYVALDSGMVAILFPTEVELEDENGTENTTE